MKAKINIKKSHRGLFTKKAEEHGMTVQSFASHVLAHPDSYDEKTRKQAQFAHNFDGNKKQTGGIVKPYLQRNTFATDATQDAQFANEFQQPQFSAPAQLTPEDFLNTTQQGQVVADQFKQKGFRPVANNGSNKILFAKGTGVYEENPIVKDVNIGLEAATGVANFFNNNKLKKQEQLQVLQNNQPAYYENMEAEGLNNLPMYTKYGGETPESRQGLAHKNGTFYGQTSIYPKFKMGGACYPVLRPYGGGPLTADGAKEILRDGTVNGKKLTPKQKRYFGFVAGGGKPKHQTGGGSDQQPDPQDIINAFARLQGVDAETIYQQLENMDDGKKQQALDQMFNVIQQSQQDAGTGEPDQQPAQTQPLMKMGGKPSLKKKYQTGGAPQQAVSPQDQFYRDSATLNYYKQKLNENLKAKNPKAYQSYFQGMTDVVKSNPSNPYGPQRDAYIQNNQYNDYLSPEEVQKSLGDEDYQRYLNSIKGVNSYNVTQGKQPLYGTEEGNKDINKLNYGRRFASLAVTPTYSTSQTNQTTGKVNTYRREYQYDPTSGNVNYTETGDTNLVPSYLKPKPVLPSATAQQTGTSGTSTGTMQTGGQAVPTTTGLPDEFSQFANVNAEEGEVIEKNNGHIMKVADNAGTHEQGGVDLANVDRVLENTSKLRKKDPVSKILSLKPEEVNKMFGFTPKKDLSHAEAFEDAKDHYGKKRIQIQKNQDIINTRPELDPLSAKSAELNYKTNANLPTDDEVFDMLFGHQQFVKELHGIQDDGGTAQYGGYVIKKAQAGFDSSAAPDNSTDLGLYKGPKVKKGRNLYTPTGQTSEAKLKDQDIIDRYKSVGVDFGNKRGKDLQSAIYNYLIDNQPDVLRQTLKEYGPNIQSETKGLNKSKAFTDPLNASVDDLKKALPGLLDGFVGARIPLPSQSTETQQQAPEYPTVAQPDARPTLPSRQPNPNVTINPKFPQQPSNKFHEPTYFDELAPGLISLTDSMTRDPELYNSQQFHQLKYKLLDPTATLNANQADFEAAASALGNNNVGSGVAAANLANLTAQKYKANAQTLGAYDNQNAGIKNNEITYNTQVRDKQSAADASARGQYYRNVQIARDNQRIQRLKAIEDLGRVIQMKRRQNNSGNLVLKLSPAFDQNGEYNGYQTNFNVPPELGFNGALNGSGVPVPAPAIRKPTAQTKTTTQWKLGDKTIKTETRQ